MQAEFKVNVKAYWNKNGKLEVFETGSIMEENNNDDSEEDEAENNNNEGNLRI